MNVFRAAINAFKAFRRAILPLCIALEETQAPVNACDIIEKINNAPITWAACPLPDT
ncbi:MAG: hypothetical protein ACTSYQ_03535 [Candidatus Odinarchaeia archaeon]